MSASFFARRAVGALRTAPALRATPIARTLRTSAVLRADSHAPPVIQGEGAKPGEVATDETQSTGLERFELLGKLQGMDVFDMEPLESDRLGTKKDPIVVKSLFPTRIIGCTGSPAGSHDTIWLHLNLETEHHRCPECGSVSKLDFQGDPALLEGGHH